MKGNGVKSVFAENLMAASAQQAYSKWANRQLKLCWKCQKDKPRQGGKETMMAGFHNGLRKFICMDCIEAKQKKNEEQK